MYGGEYQIDTDWIKNNPVNELCSIDGEAEMIDHTMLKYNEAYYHLVLNPYTYNSIN